MIKTKEKIVYAEVQAPTTASAQVPVDLTGATMQIHAEKILKRMDEEKIDILFVYADREHGTNFGYLTGFEPRFEEAVLALQSDGQAFLMLGNESLRMKQYSRIPAEAIHVPYFSLPNQPMGNTKTLVEFIQAAGAKQGMKAGIAGWKLFSSIQDENDQLYDVPYFIVDSIKKAVGPAGVTVNATPLFIHPGKGARVQMNANEIAHYEFGASLASSCMRRMLDKLEVGMTEMELADELAVYGQPNNVQTICATGERFTNAVVAPRSKKIKIGDKFSATVGYRGGLTSRSGYVVSSADQLPPEVFDYVEAVAKPYFAASVAWYENMGLGIKGGEIYKIIESVLPKDSYGWKLNPGHLTAGEEWMSSPLYPSSEIAISSGMLFQMDIIPSVPGYGGAGAEDGIAIADENLRKELAETYPDVWERIEARRKYMIDTLNIQIKPELLPLSNMNGYFRPFLLNKTSVFKVERT